MHGLIQLWYQCNSIAIFSVNNFFEKKSNWKPVLSQENYDRNIYIEDKTTKFGRDVCFDLLINKKNIAQSKIDPYVFWLTHESRGIYVYRKFTTFHPAIWFRQNLVSKHKIKLFCWRTFYILVIVSERLPSVDGLIFFSSELEFVLLTGDNTTIELIC